VKIILETLNNPLLDSYYVFPSSIGVNKLEPEELRELIESILILILRPF
jgi:hypothetical protein